MIRLHQFATPPAWAVPNLSPFCMKVETYLRMAGLPYETVNGNPRKGPKKKLPYIEDGATVVGDSGAIVDYLQRTYGDPLDAGLGARDRALGTALRRMAEEHLYWVIVYARWVDEAGWRLVSPALFGPMPAPLRALIPPMVRRGVRGSVYAQGVGRHSRDEVFARGQADLTALAGCLGDQAWFLGDRPTSVDASLFSFVENILAVPFENPLRDHARSLGNLVDYCARMKARYYAAPVT